MTAGFAMDPVRWRNAVAPAFPQETAIVTAISLTRSACAAAVALRMPMPTESVTMWTTAWARPMRLVSAMAIAPPMPMPTAFVMTWTIALVNWTNAAFVMAPVRLGTVAVMTFRWAIATATATSSTPSACVVEAARRMRMRTGFVTTSTTAWARPMPSGCAMATARRTPTRMASVTTWTTALVSLTNVACATDRAPSTTAGAPPCRTRIVTATETSSTPLAIAVGPARRMPMGTASAMTWTTA